jgi:hypothetical protein
MPPPSSRHNGPVQWRLTQCASRAGSAQAVVRQGLVKSVVKKKQWTKTAKQGQRVAPRPTQPLAVQSPPVARSPAVPVEGAAAGYRRVRSHEDQPAGARAVLELAPVVEKLAPALVEAPGEADRARGWRDRRPRVR